VTGNSAAATLWRHRWLWLGFVRREITSRYLGSVGGLAWALLHPLALLAIYSLVFQAVFKVRFTELDQFPFVVFVATVLWPWMAFQEGLMRGTQAVVQHAALVKKVPFPHELLVYAAVTATFVVQLVGYALVCVLLALMGHALHWSALGWVVCWLLLLYVFTLALALGLATVQVFLRDVEQVLSQVLMVLFYATPILYPLSLVPVWLQDIMRWNPLMQVLDSVRQALLFGLGSGVFKISIMALAVTSLFWLARKLFRRMSPYFEDMV
jgi:lipopolysaccharide transport system permease protein